MTIGSTLLIALASTCLVLPASASAMNDELDAAEQLRARQPPAGAEITFLGYRSLPGGRGTLFVELSDTVVVEVGHSGQTFEYKMLGARVPLRNNRHPLLLRDFDSSALSAVLVLGKKAVSLVVTLRGTATPAHRMVSRGKGAVLEVDLPPLSDK